MTNQNLDSKLVLKKSNSRTGGPKTTEGKSIAKYNALKHGILANIMTPYDDIDLGQIHSRLVREFAPQSVIEDVLVERISLYLLRLHRIAKAESEHVRKSLNPTITESMFSDDILKPVVIKKGYVPEIGEADILPLFNLYHRYEKSLENRLYRAIQELVRIKNSGND